MREKSEANPEKLTSPREALEVAQGNANNHSVAGQDYHSAAAGYKGEGRSVSASRNQLEGKGNIAGNKQKVVNTKTIYPYQRNPTMKHSTASNGKAISIRSNMKVAKKVN